MIAPQPLKCEFRQVIDMPANDCVLCAGKNHETGNPEVYLVFQERHQAFIRNEITSDWEEIKEHGSVDGLISDLRRVLKDRRVKIYSSSC